MSSSHNQSLLSRFIGTVKQSWSRQSLAVASLSRVVGRQVFQTDSRRSTMVVPVTLLPPVTDARWSEEDLTRVQGHTTEQQRVHTQLEHELETLPSQNASEFSTMRFDVTGFTKVKYFRASWALRAALISVSLALSRTPAEAVRPRIRG